MFFLYLYLHLMFSCLSIFISYFPASPSSSEVFLSLHLHMMFSRLSIFIWCLPVSPSSSDVFLSLHLHMMFSWLSIFIWFFFCIFIFIWCFPVSPSSSDVFFWSLHKISLLLLHRMSGKLPFYTWATCSGGHMERRMGSAHSIVKGQWHEIFILVYLLSGSWQLSLHWR